MGANLAHIYAVNLKAPPGRPNRVNQAVTTGGRL